MDKDPNTIAELRDVCRKVEAAADLRRTANESRQRAPQTAERIAGAQSSRTAADKESTRTYDNDPRMCYTSLESS